MSDLNAFDFFEDPKLWFGLGVDKSKKSLTIFYVGDSVANAEQDAQLSGFLLSEDAMIFDVRQLDDGKCLFDFLERNGVSSADLPLVASGLSKAVLGVVQNKEADITKGEVVKTIWGEVPIPGGSY